MFNKIPIFAGFAIRKALEMVGPGELAQFVFIVDGGTMLTEIWLGEMMKALWTRDGTAKLGKNNVMVG